MSFLIIQESQKEDLKFLREQPNPVLVDFCKLAWGYLKNGPNMKLYQAASQKLGVEAKQIQLSVEGLAYFFIQAEQNDLNEQTFRETALNLDFSEESCQTLHTEFLNHKDLIGEALPLTEIPHYEFKNLEWRFHTEVASRTMKNKLEPKILLKFDLQKGDTIESVCLESDIPNIMHLNEVLNQAVEESKSQHSKRIHRALS